MTIQCTQPACQTTAGCQCGWDRAIKRAETAIRVEKSMAAFKSTPDEMDESLWRFWNQKARDMAVKFEEMRNSRAELYKAFDTLTDQHEALRKELDQAKATIAELQGLQVTEDICAGKIRRDALEEAAKIADRYTPAVTAITLSEHKLGAKIAASIRALAATGKTQEGESDAGN